MPASTNPNFRYPDPEALRQRVEADVQAPGEAVPDVERQQRISNAMEVERDRLIEDHLNQVLRRRWGTAPVVGTGQPFTSTSFANLVPSVSIEITKALKHTRLMVDMAGEFVLGSGGPDGVTLGARINGVDYTIASATGIAGVPTHPVGVGVPCAADLDPGVYTITGRVKVTGGTFVWGALATVTLAAIESMP